MTDDFGKLIKIALEQQERKPQWLANKIGCDRTNIYKIFNRKDIDVSTLVRISRALHCNLLKNLAQELENELNNKEREKMATLE